MKTIPGKLAIGRPLNIFEKSVPRQQWKENITLDTVLSIDDSSTLTFLQQSTNLEMQGDCPSIDMCMQNCRKSYTVEATQSQYILTSTYADTSECICDKLVFTSASIRGDSATFNWKFNYVIEDSDTGRSGVVRFGKARQPHSGRRLGVYRRWHRLSELS